MDFNNFYHDYSIKLRNINNYVIYTKYCLRNVVTFQSKVR